MPDGEANNRAFINRSEREGCEVMPANEPISMAELILRTRSYVREYMQRYDSSHDFKHVERVLRLAMHIREVEQSSLDHDCHMLYNKDIVELAALLHDVGDKKYLLPGQDSGSMIHDFLVGQGATEKVAYKVQTIALHVSYSNEIRHPDAVASVLSQFPELAVVQDADRLDAIGAVGIGRCFTFSAHRANASPPEIASQSTMEDAIEHFGDKLELLAGRMKTNTGRIMAEQRTRKIQEFRRWWLEETEFSTQT